MAKDDQGEKTEAPTQQRRDQAREQGQVAHSVDLSAAVVLLGTMIALNFMGGRILTELGTIMAKLLDVRQGPAWDLASVGETIRMCTWGMALVLMPLLLTIMALATLSNLMQVGILFTAEPLMPSWNKISPMAGLKRLFSWRSIIRLVMSLGKVTVIGVLSYMMIQSRMGRILASTDMGFSQIAAAAGAMVFTLSVRIAIVLLVLAILDYLFQRWQHEKDLRMTREELKEDLKRMEGDPQIRARRQRIARQLAMQRMSLEVPRSTVVVTNPTHLAIALLYKDSMNAPKVIAKGADLLAVRIRQIAAASGVPIVERKPLAQALYKTCDVGDEIPAEMYKAVAEVLAYVFELAKEKKIGRAIPAGVGSRE